VVVPQRRQDEHAQQASDADNSGACSFGLVTPKQQTKQAAGQHAADSSGDRPTKVETNQGGD
jgi:hypothetical protein